MITETELSRAFTIRTGLVQEVRAVALHVDAVEIVGFFRPGAAGKTTTLRMSTTLLRPTGSGALQAWPVPPCRRRAPPMGPDS